MDGSDGNMLLNGKNAIVTGCLRGIGRATMELFARNGANIWACCQNQDEEFERDIRELSKEIGVAIVPVYFDLADNEQLKAGLRTIAASKQKIDVLVNVAGMTHNALFHMTSMEKMKYVFEIDFFSQIQVTQYITKIMAKQKSGNVINISSIAGMDGNPGQIAYSSCKAALIGATKTLAAELAPYNIRVNAIAPGVIETNMTSDLPQEAFSRLMSKSCIKRKGVTDEVANVLLFLASDLSSYVTGQVIRVDGGIG